MILRLAALLLMVGLALSTTAACGKGEPETVPASPPSPSPTANSEPGETTPEPSEPRDIAVATVLYQWFGYEHNPRRGWPGTGGLGTFHWNDIVFNQLPTGFVANRPAKGYYASDDEAVIARQLEEMAESGIDTIIVSWWGWGDVDLDGTYDGYIEQRSHDALINLLKHIREHQLDFKVALLVEPWPDVVGSDARPGNAKNLGPEQKQLIFDYAWDEVYSKYADIMFSWEAKPLLIASAELYFDPGSDNRFTLRSFRYKNSDHEPGNSWNWDVTEPMPYFQTLNRTVVLSPRYDEWFLAAAHPDWWPWAWNRECAVRHDPELTEKLYDYQWQEIHERRDEIDLVIIWGWNSWMEQLYIEPDDGEGVASAGDSLLRKTAWYVTRLRSGEYFRRFDREPGELPPVLPRQVACQEQETFGEKPDIELGVALHLLVRLRPRIRGNDRRVRNRALELRRLGD